MDIRFGRVCQWVLMGLAAAAAAGCFPVASLRPEEQAQALVAPAGGSERLSSLPGQDGELTEALAFLLVQSVMTDYGTDRMQVSATGGELERGRRLAASGAPVSQAVVNWRRTVESYLVLEPVSPDQYRGVWMDSEGMATGEYVLFVRVHGLWKVADHTEGGRQVGLLDSQTQ